MKIESPNKSYTLQNTQNLVEKSGSAEKETKLPEPVEPKVKDLFEKTPKINRTHIYDLLSVKNMNKEAGSILEQLTKMIDEMVKQQSEVIELLRNLEETNLERPPKTTSYAQNTTKILKEAHENIQSKGNKRENFQVPRGKSPDNNLINHKRGINGLEILYEDFLDVEASSEEIVEFLKGVNKEGKATLSILAKEVIKIFDGLEKERGSLPQISKKTYNRTRIIQQTN